MLFRFVFSNWGCDCQYRVWRNTWRKLRVPAKSTVRHAGASRYRNFMSGRKLSYTERDKPHNLPQSTEQHGRIAEFERALFRRLEQAGFKRSKRFYWTVIASTVLVFAGAYIYFFPHKLRQQVVEEVSTVASQSLEDEKIVTKAGQLSKDVLNEILNDGNTKAVASDFVKDVIVSDPIRDAAVGTILRLLHDPEVLNLLRSRLSEIILAILQDESTRQIVMSQVNIILQHESIRQSLQTLLYDLTNTPEVKKLMSEFFKDVLSSDTVKNQGAILGQQVTSDVISSKEIQEQAGYAIWSALKHSVVPSIFKGKGNNEKGAVVEDMKPDNPAGELQDLEESPLDADEKLDRLRDLEVPISGTDAYDRYNRYTMDDDL